jgi:glycosyltransferase involved in cell wall biosynthesis
MNITYICSDFGIPIHGNKGASIHVREFSTAMVRLGHRVEIVSPRRGGEAPASFPVPVIQLRPGADDTALTDVLKRDPAAGDLAANEIRSMLYNTTLPFAALPYLQLTPPDAIYERYALFGTGGIALARRFGIPHILEVNAPLSAEQRQHRGCAFADATSELETHILQSTSHIVTVSDTLKSWMTGLGIAPDRITVAPNGVDIDRFAVPVDRATAIRDLLGVGSRLVVGFVGTLKGWHGTASLIRAFALIVRSRTEEPVPHLVIVGDGPQREMLEGLSAHEGIAHLTTFAGTVDHAEIPAWIATMDIVTAPYDDSENHYFSPLKLFEYMAAGKPIVAAGIGQIADVIRDGDTGLLYRPGDDASLARTINRLLDDPLAATALGHAARLEAQARYSWERNALTVTGLIQREQDRQNQSGLVVNEHMS